MSRLRELLPDQWQPLPKDERGLIVQKTWSDFSSLIGLSKKERSGRLMLVYNIIPRYPSRRQVVWSDAYATNAVLVPR